ncbi:MAG: elongation factor P hydroxylase [Gammaproteobacteria bacterium]|nr:elongation factor P hydroxylase [Gammaproteobacteria bacterium]
MTTDRQIAGRFNASIGQRYRTLLVGGALEPLYIPSVGRVPAIIHYTRDYAQSVLHEVSHWCLAGNARRRLRDYGYWYVPPPRSDDEQAAFYAVEKYVQALESVLADACGLKFRVSADQIGADVHDFACTVADLAHRIRNQGIRGRAAEVLAALRTQG